MAAMFVNGSGRNDQSLQRTFHRCFLPSFDSFGKTVSEENNFLNQPIRNKSRLWRPFLLTDRDEMSNEGLPQMLPTKFQFIWLRILEAYLSAIQFTAIQFIANCILLISIFKLELSPFPQKTKKAYNHKHEFPVAAMFVNGSGRNEQSLQRTFHRCSLPSFSSFGPVVSEKKVIKNRPIRNKNCLWRPCLLIDRDEISNLQRGPSIDASYHVSVHLAERFQRRRLKCEKLTDDG